MSVPIVRNLVWLDDAQDPITDADLYGADVEDGILSAKRDLERGVTPSFEVTLSHPGWTLYAPSAKRAAALVTHTDGTMATAVVKARGWLRDLPSSLLGETVTLIFEARDDDDDGLNARRQSAARAVLLADRARAPWRFGGDGTATASPYRDLLFGQAQRLMDDVLAGRSAWVRYDPVTHACTVVENRAPARRRHNVGDGYDPSSLQVSEGDGAVSEVTWTIHANLSISASGTCNLASVLPSISSLSGYTVSAPASLGSNAGWTFGQSNEILAERHVGDSAEFRSGRVWQYKTRKIEYVKQTSSNGNEVVNTRYGQVYTYTVDEMYKARREDTSFWWFPAKYSYSQTRRDTLKLRLRVPCQRAGGIRRTLDLGETTLASLYTPVLDEVLDTGDGDDEPDPPSEMQDGQPYAAGDLAYYGGALYRALADNPGSLYVVQADRKGVFSTVVNQLWEDTGLRAPVIDRTVTSFWGSPRGKAAAAHAFRRMARRAIDRLYDGWSVTATVEREYLPDVDLDDEVYLLVPGRWDEPMKAVLGEVQKVSDSWDGEAGDTVTVTLRVATGDGTDDEADVSSIEGGFEGEGFGDGFAISNPHTTDSDLVNFRIVLDGLEERIDLRRLEDPVYVFRGSVLQGSADEQLGEAIARAGASQEPIPANTSTPTTLAVQLLPLVSERTVRRTATAEGDLLYSPRGIDLGA